MSNILLSGLDILWLTKEKKNKKSLNVGNTYVVGSIKERRVGGIWAWSVAPVCLKYALNRQVCGKGWLWGQQVPHRQRKIWEAKLTDSIDACDTEENMETWNRNDEGRVYEKWHWQRRNTKMIDKMLDR